MKLAVLLYGIITYLIFLTTFLYAIGFVGDIFVPKTIDSNPSDSIAEAIIVNTLLLGSFAIQHSVMARPAFKAWWTKIIPHSIERSTYVLFASLLLGLLFWQWRGIGGEVWSVDGTISSFVLGAISGLGWLIVLLSTFMINHFDLFGLRQVYLEFSNREYSHPPFKVHYFYKFVRHPLMLGFLIAFWFTPHMTVGHLFFSVVTTCYIFIGIFLEERDLTVIIGEPYGEYRQQVSMIFPLPKGKGTTH